MGALLSTGLKVNSENFDNKGDSISIFLSHDSYMLELRTVMLKERLKKQWSEYGFVYPFITEQYLIFYKHGKQITKHLIPVKKELTELENGNKVSLLSIPIFDICLFKNGTTFFYQVYGANFCNGKACPEFFGFYSMDGETLLEQVTPKNYFKGSTKNAFEYFIGIDNKDTCVSILDFFIPID